MERKKLYGRQKSLNIVTFDHIVIKRFMISIIIGLCCCCVCLTACCACCCKGAIAIFQMAFSCCQKSRMDQIWYRFGLLPKIDTSTDIEFENDSTSYLVER